MGILASMEVFQDAGIKFVDGLFLCRILLAVILYFDDQRPHLHWLAEPKIVAQEGLAHYFLEGADELAPGGTVPDLLVQLLAR